VKRSRRGGRRPQHNNNHNGGGGHNPNRTFDSNGPEVKIRGSASHVYEKYLQLARDSNASGDRVMAENYLQHAEHYYRIMAAQQAQMAQYQQAQGYNNNQNNNNQQNREQSGGGDGGQQNSGQPQAQGASGPSFSLAENAEEDEGEEAEA
jgi:hypothetical protein